MTAPTALPDRMRASVLTGAKELSFSDLPVPAAEAGQVLIKVAKVGVCGSDVHYYRHGRVGPYVVEAPLILGHEVSGTIVEVGDGVSADRIGQRVAIEPQKPCRRCQQCMAGRYNLCPDMEFYATPPIDGAFCQYVAIESDFAHAVPNSMSDEAAALLEPLSVGIAAIRKAGVVPGSRVLIAGGGPIGVITAQVARAFGAAEVIVSDPVLNRRELALKFGATSVLDPMTEDSTSLQVDAFIDACGVSAAVIAGLNSVRPAGVVVLVGIGAAEIPFPISSIMDRELVVTGIFRYTDTWPLAIHLVSSGQVDLDSLVTGRFSLDEVEAALNASESPTSLKSIVEIG